MTEYSGFLDEQLIEAYMNTEYRVLKPSIIIKIGQNNPLMNELLMDNNVYDYAFITAENPFSRSVSKGENEGSMQKLAQELEKRQLIYLPGIGIHPSGDWPGENSFLVLDLHPDDAIEIGKAFQQNAIVVGQLGEVARLEVIRY